MKRIHLVFGLVLVLVFLLTGQYMEYVHNRTLPDGIRILYRSRHIYLLLNALINITLGLLRNGRVGYPQSTGTITARFGGPEANR